MTEKIIRENQLNTRKGNQLSANQPSLEVPLRIVRYLLFVCLFVFFLSFLLPGEFADVYKGTLQTPKGKEIVAIKVLRVSIIFGAYYFLGRPFHSRIFNSLEVLKCFFPPLARLK